MNYLRIIGGRALQGELEIQGAKNSVLPILAATLLNRGQAYSIAARACRMWTLRSAFCCRLGCSAGVGGGHAVCTYRRHGLR